MNDSTDKNKELDQYGVWVKNTSHGSPANSSDSSDSIGETLPDFSFIDTPSKDDAAVKTNAFEAADTSLTPDELSHVAVSVPEEKLPAENGDEEIALDDFITGGFSDDSATAATPAKEPAADGEVSLDDFLEPDTGSAQSAPAADGEVSLDSFLGPDSGATTAASASDGEVSLDSFLGPSSGSSTDEVSLDDFMSPSSGSSSEDTKADEIVDEKPMDIDLSFDDSLSVPEETPAEELQPESIDLEDFSSASKKETEPAQTAAPAANNGSQNVDLDNFDSVFSTLSGDSEQTVSSETNEKSGVTENVNLSDFGIDADSDNQNVVIASDGTPKQKAAVDYDMQVSTDEESVTSEPIEESSSDNDKDEVVALDTQVDQNAVKDAPAPEMTFSPSAPEEDFDVDSILNSVKDEQGKTVCVGKVEDAVSKEVESVPLEETPAEQEVIVPETIEDLSAEPATDNAVAKETIPDTFEEESSFLSSYEKSSANGMSDIPEYLPDDIAASLNLESPTVNDEPADDQTISFANDAPDENMTSSFTDTEAAKAQETPAVEDAKSSAEAPKQEKTVFEDDTTSNAGEPNIEMDDENRALLEKIAGDLSSLKKEIKELKSEFEDLKKNGAPAATTTPAAEAEEDKSEGFFTGTDEDDTIALSGDELDNILNNADFTTAQPAENAPLETVDEPEAVDETKTVDEPETITPEEPVLEDAEPAEDHNVADNGILGPIDSSIEIPEQDEYDNEPTGLKMDFSNEKLEEPVFDTTEDFSAAQPEHAAQEPTANAEEKADDILVESSPTDLMDTDVTTADEKLAVSSVEQAEELPPAKAEIIKTNSLTKPIDLFEDDKPSPLTEDKINYLAEDEKEDNVIETGISEEPVNNVFTQWNNDSAKKEASAEPPAETTATEDSSIPSDMKQEIKSVLSYMDQLLENLPEDKITEFAKSEQFETYKKLFTELGLA